MKWRMWYWKWKEVVVVLLDAVDLLILSSFLGFISDFLSIVGRNFVQMFA